MQGVVEKAILSKPIESFTQSQRLWFTPSDLLQVKAMVPDMLALADQHPDPARVRSVVNAAAVSFVISLALIFGAHPDLRYEYRMAARGRIAPPTFAQWLEQWTSGRLDRESMITYEASETITTYSTKVNNA
ncbi:hypothetical protein H9P43_007322 [Blastocladiella emersonii ATCC 22665]|nr:hypothetical protein H9P43_007322 [Blastocladiella emersonii ATCC 22665]